MEADAPASVTRTPSERAEPRLGSRPARAASPVSAMPSAVVTGVEGALPAPPQRGRPHLVGLRSIRPPQPLDMTWQRLMPVCSWGSRAPFVIKAALPAPRSEGDLDRALPIEQPRKGTPRARCCHLSRASCGYPANVLRSASQLLATPRR